MKYVTTILNVMRKVPAPSLLEKEAVVEGREEEEEEVEVDNRVEDFKDSEVVQGDNREEEVGGSKYLEGKG